MRSDRELCAWLLQLLTMSEHCAKVHPEWLDINDALEECAVVVLRTLAGHGGPPDLTHPSPLRPVS